MADTTQLKHALIAALPGDISIEHTICAYIEPDYTGYRGPINVTPYIHIDGKDGDDMFLFKYDRVAEVYGTVFGVLHKELETSPVVLSYLRTKLLEVADDSSAYHKDKPFAGVFWKAMARPWAVAYNWWSNVNDRVITRAENLALMCSKLKELKEKALNVSEASWFGISSNLTRIEDCYSEKLAGWFDKYRSQARGASSADGVVAKMNAFLDSMQSDLHGDTRIEQTYLFVTLLDRVNRATESYFSHIDEYEYDTVKALFDLRIRLNSLYARWKYAPVGNSQRRDMLGVFPAEVRSILYSDKETKLYISYAECRKSMQELRDTLAQQYQNIEKKYMLTPPSFDDIVATVNRLAQEPTNEALIAEKRELDKKESEIESATLDIATNIGTVAIHVTQGVLRLENVIPGSDKQIVRCTEEQAQAILDKREEQQKFRAELAALNIVESEMGLVKEALNKFLEVRSMKRELATRRTEYNVLEASTRMSNDFINQCKLLGLLESRITPDFQFTHCIISEKRPYEVEMTVSHANTTHLNARLRLYSVDFIQNSSQVVQNAARTEQ